MQQAQLLKTSAECATQNKFLCTKFNTYPHSIINTDHINFLTQNPNHKV